MEHHQAMGKLTNSVDMFNSFVKLLEGNNSVMYQPSRCQVYSSEVENQLWPTRGLHRIYAKDGILLMTLGKNSVNHLLLCNYYMLLCM